MYVVLYILIILPQKMYNLIYRLLSKQIRFFTWYFVAVITLIAFSYIEGVGDISGTVLLDISKTVHKINFKAGYLSSLNYGIYYLIFLPLFLRAVFATYQTAERLSNLPWQDEPSNDLFIKKAIRDYSSNITKFLKKKIAIIIFISLLIFFLYQNFVVEKKDYKGLSLGWVQGLELKKRFDSPKDTLYIQKKFFFRNEMNLTNSLIVFDSVKVTNISFASSRIPPQSEFIIFIILAKMFFSLFTTIVFFFNINIVVSLIYFLKERNKKSLFGSKQFIQTIDELISNISMAGFFATIFLYCRYITNSQKGSFKPFNWNNIFSNDQYLFVLGMIFIPLSAIALFTYVYISNQSVSLKNLSLRNIITFYIPNLAFAIIFLIYLLCFDPYFESQLKFLNGSLQFFNKFLLG